MGPRVTILIPTCNRSLYLERQIKYLTDDRSNNFYKIIILDGSYDEYDISKNQTIADKYGVFYKWYNSNFTRPYDRMIDFINSDICRSEFIQVVPDDDFINKFAIPKHAEILDRNQNAIGVFGKIIDFKLLPKKKNKKARLMFDKTRNDCNYEQTSPLERIFRATFDKSRASYYCLYRTDIFRKILLVTKEVNYYFSNEKNKQLCEGVDLYDFYIVDFAMHLIGLVIGNKINSSLPYFAIEKGQRFEVTEEQRNRKTPSRKSHSELLLDKKYDFPTRAQKFIQVMTKVYLEHYTLANSDMVKNFFQDILLAFFGSIATGPKFVNKYIKANKRIEGDDYKTSQILYNRTISKSFDISNMFMNNITDSTDIYEIEFENVVCDFKFAIDALKNYAEIQNYEVTINLSNKLKCAAIYPYHRETE
jgi:glycosyltransferase domain-containing protein